MLDLPCLRMGAHPQISLAQKRMVLHHSILQGEADHSRRERSMTDADEQELRRKLIGDRSLARSYVNQILRRGGEESLAELLAGELLDLRSRLLLQNAEAFSFWGGEVDEHFKITVTREFGPEGGWTLVQHWGDTIREPWDVHQASARVLCHGQKTDYAWSQDLTNVGFLIEEQDIYVAALLAVNVCEGRIQPVELEDANSA